MKKITLKIDNNMMLGFYEMLVRCTLPHRQTDNVEAERMYKHVVYEFVFHNNRRFFAPPAGVSRFSLKPSEAIAIYMLFLKLDFSEGSLSLCRGVLQQLDLATKKMMLIE